MNKRKDLESINLKRLYLEEKLSTVDIGQKLGISASAIRNALIQQNIPIRSRQAAASNRGTMPENLSEMVRRYMEDGITSTQLALEYNTSTASITQWLRKGGAIVRPRGYLLLKNSDGSTRVGRPSKLSKELLLDLYQEQGLTAPQIAEQFDMDLSSIYNAMNRYQIPRRNREEVSAKCWKDKRRDWRAIKSRYEQGETIDQIAQDEELSTSTVHEHLWEVRTKVRPRGVSLNSPLFRTELDMDYIIAQNKSGRTLADISRELNISPQLLFKRTREIGYKPQNNKPKLVNDPFGKFVPEKRKVARAINAVKCIICKEPDPLELAHIKPKRWGGPLVPENIICLCRNHSWLFDHGRLTERELKLVQLPLIKAKEQGYEHQIYKVTRGKVHKSKDES